MQTRPGDLRRDVRGDGACCTRELHHDEEGTGAVSIGLNRRRAESLVMELMAIEGPSCHEGRVAERIREHLLAAGAEPGWISNDTAHKRTPAPGEVGNLIMKVPGAGSLKRAPRRMLSAHLDTVPVCVGSQPKRKGDVVTSVGKRDGGPTGLGADNRAGCAVLLATALELLDQDLPRPPLTFCWFVQEEIGLQGARNVSLAKLGNPPLAFNWDGGGPAKLTIGATGGIRMRIDITGIASHAGGAPEQGVSALAIAALAIADLHRGGWHGDVHGAKGEHGTSNVGTLHGGVATNVVADQATLLAECRSHDGKFRQRIAREMERAFKDAAKQVRNVAGQTGKVKIESRLDYDSFLLKPDEPCVLIAEEAVRRAGLDPVRAVANGGLDANWITKHGIPTVSLGCGQRNQHMVTEQLVMSEFLSACEIAFRIATEP
ncbi:MAG: M20/M25/M40 family metallo-hydrolase [Planctomycetales bacterium]|nr:M20/M25/M40 family metallo-hydrolase [Planctomycetales bacterium]